MRTTLTIDDNLYRLIRDLSRREGKSFKQAVNDLLRRGLSEEKKPEKRAPFRVEAKHCGFQPGIDIARLNQISDDIEIEGQVP